MATIVGPVKNSSGVNIPCMLRFTLVNGPQGQAPGVMTDQPLEVVSSDGNFSLVLGGGVYDVEIVTSPHTSLKFRITIAPNDPNTYTLDQVMTTGRFVLPTYGTIQLTSIKLFVPETGRYHELKAVQIGDVIDTRIEQ